MDYTKEEIAEALSGITRDEWSDALALLEIDHSECNHPDTHENCYADQCLAETSGTIDNECKVAKP